MSYVVRSSPTPALAAASEQAPLQQHVVKQQNKAKNNNGNAASTLASSLPQLQMSVSPSPSSAVTPRATMANNGGQMSYSAALFKSLDSLAASSQHQHLQVNANDFTRPQSQQSLRSQYAASLTPNASGSLTPNAGSPSVSTTPSRSPTPMSHSYEYSTSMLRDGQSVNSFNYTNSHTQSPRSSSKTSSGASTPLAAHSISAMNLHGLSITSDSFHEKLWDLERREREGELNISGESSSHSPQSLNVSNSSSSSVAEEKESSGSSSRASNSVPTTAKPRAILPPAASSLVDSFVRSSSHPPAGAKDAKKNAQQLQAPPAADAINYPALTSVGANGMPKGAWSKTLSNLVVKSTATPSAGTPLNQPSTPKAQAQEADAIVDAIEQLKDQALPTTAVAELTTVDTDAAPAADAVAEPPKKKGRKAARRERAALEAAARAKAEAEGCAPNTATTLAVPAPKLTSAASSPSLSTATDAPTAPSTRASRKAANKAAREAAEKAKASTTATAPVQPTIPKAKSFTQLNSAGNNTNQRQLTSTPSNFPFTQNQNSLLPPNPSQPLLRFTPVGLPPVYGPPATPSLLPSHSTIGQPPPRLEMIKLQLEYYFSANNLAKDLFLRGMMNSRGYVPVCKLLEFPRLKALTTRPIDMLTAAKASQYLKQKNGALRSKNDWHKYLPTLDQMSDQTDEEDEAIKEKNIASPFSSSSEVSESTPAPATTQTTPHSAPHPSLHAPVPSFQPLPPASFMPNFYPPVAFAPYPTHLLPVYSPPVNPPLYTITYHTPPQPLHLFPQNVTPTIAGPMIHMAPLVPLPKRKTTTTATPASSTSASSSTPAASTAAAPSPSESTTASSQPPRAAARSKQSKSAKTDAKKESASGSVATEASPSA